MFAFAFFTVTWLLLWLLLHRAIVSALALEDPMGRFAAGIAAVFLATFVYIGLLVAVGNMGGRP